ncbi:MAG: DUF3450 domain-containing protein [Planctomycetota bacterium]|nr:DUF3450 domain-containing protein [Planctomycetota bacterium]
MTGLSAFIACALTAAFSAFSPCPVPAADEGGIGEGGTGEEVRGREAAASMAEFRGRSVAAGAKAATKPEAAGEGPGEGGQSPDKAGASVRNEDAAALLAILKEVRELEATLAREEAEWRAEERESKAILAQRRARLEETERRRAELARRVSESERELEGKKRKRESLAAEAGAWRKWMSGSIGKACAVLSDKPFLSETLEGPWSDRGLDRAKNDMATKRTGEAAASFWNAMLGICARGTEAEVRMMSVKLNGAAGEMPVLRLGGIGAICLSRDGSSCAMAVAHEGGIAWVLVPEEWQAAARYAVRVGRRDVAADIVVVPLPRSAVSEESVAGEEEKR